MRCDIVIPVWNELDHTRTCIESIERNTEIPYRIILIDNASDEETRNYLAMLARDNKNIALITNKENLGFIKAVNKGLRMSNAPYVCIMNNDTIATSGWLSRMIELAEAHNDIGLVNPKSEAPGRLSVDKYGKMLAKNKGEFVETNQCLGFCMLVKRGLIENIGLLDEIYDVGGFDDTDFSMRAHKAGYKCVSCSDAYVYHKWHTSFKKAGNREILVRRNEKIFSDRWGKGLRIAYPVPFSLQSNIISDIYTSLGLARQWNWVHVWLNGISDSGEALEPEKLPKHQNMRLFNSGKNTAFFYSTVLFKLIERNIKRKKPYDAVLVSDPKMFKILLRFKRLFNTPIFCIEKEKFPIDIKDAGSWTRRADIVAGIIKEGIKK